MTLERLQVGIIAPPPRQPLASLPSETTFVLDALARGLKARGHRVVLVGHDSQGYDPDTFRDCDIVHDHTLAGPFLGQLQNLAPVVATSHGHFGAGLADRYRRCRTKVPMIAVSHDQAAAAPPGVEVETVIHHGLDLDGYHFNPNGGEYLFCDGHLQPGGGLDWAIDTARRVGLPLLFTGRIHTPRERRYYVEELRPRMGRGIEYIGELDNEERLALIEGAHAFLNPCRAIEPFRIQLIEAMACGTPVIACPVGVAPEIIEHGSTGYLANNMGDLARAVRMAGRLDRQKCRTATEERFSMAKMAAEHERFYRSVAKKHLVDQQLHSAAIAH